MRRTVLRRVLSVAVAAWFCTWNTEAVAHACPMHAAASVPGASHGGHTAAVTLHDHAAMHHGDAPDGGGGTPPAPAGHTCTCPGACCASAIVVPPTAPAFESIAVAAPPVRIGFAAARPTSPPAHARPPTTGPPAPYQAA